MSAPASALHLNVLGPLQVLVEGTQVDVPAGNQRRLIAALAVGRGRPIPAHRLVEDVWGEYLPTDPRGSLHTNIARLRRTLGTAADCLGLQQAGYALDTVSRDDDQARALITEAERLQGQARLDVLRRALDLWRGDAWAEFAEDIAVAQARSLAELRARAIQLSAWALIDIGQPTAAVELLQPVVRGDLLREHDVLPLVRALDACGRIGDAVEQFEAYRRELADRLGLDPSPALRAEQRRLLDRAESRPPGRSEPRAQSEAQPAAAKPIALGQLVGRDELVTTICDRLLPRSVVTLVGPGGVGKTALARHISERWEPSCWVDLSTLHEESSIAPAMLTALHGSDSMGTPSATNLLPRLSAWSGLLVLDNCEHVISSAADLAEQIVTSAAHVRILATSRERLDILGESVVQVPTLPGPRAEELFVDRARVLGPSMIEDEDSAELVRSIVSHVDGLPLAVELAAARVGSLTLSDVAQRLELGLDLLSGTARRRPARHRALRATMQWSYDLLEPTQRQVFRLLSCFAGDFDLDSAERVLQRVGLAAQSVSPAIADLADRSLIVSPDALAASRYRLLHVVRQFAADQLDADERRGIAQAHSDWAVEFAATAAHAVNGPDEAQWSARVRELLPDLRRVVARGGTPAEDIASSLSRWSYFAMSREVATWGENLLTHSRTPSPRLLAAAASSAWQRGDFAACATYAQHALSASEAAAAESAADHREDPYRASRAANIAADLLGDSALMTGDFAAAQRYYQQSAAGARGLGLIADESTAWCGMATAQTFAGEDGKSAAQLSLELAERSGNPSALGMAHYALGEALTATDLDRALQHFRTAQSIVTGPRPGLCNSVARTAAAAILAREGPTTASTFAEVAEMLDEWVQAGDSQFLVTALRNVIPLLVRAHAIEQVLALESVVNTVHRTSYGLEAEHLTAALDAARASGGTGWAGPGPGGGTASAPAGADQADLPVAATEVLTAARTTVRALRELGHAAR